MKEMPRRPEGMERDGSRLQNPDPLKLRKYVQDRTAMSRVAWVEPLESISHARYNLDI